MHVIFSIRSEMDEQSGVCVHIRKSRFITNAWRIASESNFTHTQGTLVCSFILRNTYVLIYLFLFQYKFVRLHIDFTRQHCR